MAGEQDRISGEAGIIAMLRPLAAGAPGAFGLFDDCAVVHPRAGMEIVLKTDPIAEGVHFLPDTAPEDIAWKALAVNVSDLAAKAAQPVGYLLALAFPDAPTHAWMARFARGLEAAQQAFGCALLGGDTDRRPGPLTVAVTALGEVEAGRMVRRATAGPSDVLFVSGTIGDAHLGLDLCKGRVLPIGAVEQASLRQRYLRPQPRLGLRTALLAHASAAMDLSDGLLKDLGRMAEASRVGADLRVLDVPLSPGATTLVGADAAKRLHLLAGGDDYEVLAAVPAGAAEAFSREAVAAGVPVTAIGRCRPGSGLTLLGPTGSELQAQVSGWDHFRPTLG